MQLEAEYEGSAVRIVAREEDAAGRLVVTHREHFSIKALFSERRHVRDLRSLADEDRTVFVRLGHDATLEEAVTSAVDLLVGRAWVGEDARECVLSPAGPRSVVECCSAETGLIVPVSVVFGEVPSLAKRVAAVVGLRGTAFVSLVLAPPEQKPTKTARKLALTVASFLTSAQVRHSLSLATSEREFRDAVSSYCATTVLVATAPRDGTLHHMEMDTVPLRGIWRDVRRRAPLYWSDWKDGVAGPKHLQKTLSTSCFLFCIILFPSLALGEAFSVGTGGAIAIQQVLWMQLVAGCGFVLVAGQPLAIVMTTAPFVLFASVLHGVAASLNVAFLPLYAWSGLFCALYCAAAAVFNVSCLIRYFTLFTEETFSLFIAASFLFTTVVETVRFFNRTYFAVDTRASAILYLFLLLFTVWLALAIGRIRKSALFNARARELLSDFCLPIAVLSASFAGSYVFQAIELPRFLYSPSGRVFVLSPLLDLPGWAIAASAGFGLILAILFVIDHSISSAMCQTPTMKTRKGSAYHWDLLVASGLCVVSSLFGLPWISASVPHAPMHTLALADVEEVTVNGTTRFEVTYSRETRLAALLANAAIGLCILALPLPLQYIPVPVLFGVFLFMAASSLPPNTLWDRALLLITQQSRYPSYSFVRRVPQRRIHVYTAVQLVCWAAMCAVAFVPQQFANLVFPLVLMGLLLVRQLLLPRLFSLAQLHELDGPHMT